MSDLAPLGNWQPPGGFANEGYFEAAVPPVETKPILQTVRAEEVEAKSIDWLDKPRLQRGAFHLIAGPKGVGKGTWLAKAAANLTRGVYGEPQSVLMVASEDSPAIDLRPRLQAAGADLARARIVTDSFVLPRDLEKLRDTVEAIGDVGMVVIDPVGNHLGGADTDKEGVIRNALAGLNQAADELGTVIIGVRHVSKNRSQGALASVLGSTAWVDLPRAVLMFAHDDEDDMQFVVQVVAGNRSGRGTATAYRIELADIGLKEPVTKCVELGESAKDVDDLLAAPRRTSKSESARELILTILENEGPQESDGLDARVAREANVAARTVQNLRKELRNAGLVKSVPDKNSDGKVTGWRVSRTSAPRGENE